VGPEIVVTNGNALLWFAFSLLPFWNSNVNAVPIDGDSTIGSHAEWLMFISRTSVLLPRRNAATMLAVVVTKELVQFPRTQIRCLVDVL
jgi:hypothetical protein